MIAMLKEPGGKLMFTPNRKRSKFGPPANYLLVNLLEEVMRSGTAPAASIRGFVVPAAVRPELRTDGWFAGFYL